MTRSFTIEAVSADHDRSSFSCNVDALDRYFHHIVRQDVRRRITACYVAVEEKTRTIAGYYTLSAGGIPLVDMPEQLAKRLPRYASVPVARLGRLAVDQNFRGQRLGATLLWDAIVRSLRSEIAVFAMVVDAKDDQAAAFYRHHGFYTFDSLSNQLILPLTNKIIGF